MNIFFLISVFVIGGIISGKAQKKNPSDFLPSGYVIFKRYYGDLNKDGREDCILIVKGNNKDDIVTNRFGKKVDRNRRGIIVLFKKQNRYQLADKNYDCFSSENEDGGVYFPPELWIEVRKGDLIIHYGHGRYGFWEYIFRFQHSGFKLIGYNASDNHGPIINSETSINFLTRKKLVRKNMNENSEGGDEVFKEMWKKIDIDKLPELAEIKDFDELDMSNF